MSPGIAKLRYRLLGMLRPQLLSWEDCFQAPWVHRGHGTLTTGRGTYWATDSTIWTEMPGDRIDVGAYCSIAPGAFLLAGGNHDTSAISQYPFTIIDRWRDSTAEPQPDQHLRIGNDVWIGAKAMIFGDITIGDGAIVAAGAVVARDVPPYSVVAGVPARVVRMRFEPAVVEQLLGLAWWEWPEEVILKAEELLRAGDVNALRAFAAAAGVLRAEGAGGVAAAAETAAIPG